MRLLYLDDIPTPYRLGIFYNFAKKFDGEFKILFCAESEPGRKWRLDYQDLSVEFLPGYQWRPRNQQNPFSYKWNSSIMRALKSFRPDVVVLSGYVHPTMQCAARWCRRNRIPYGIACESSFLQSSPIGIRWAIKKTILSSIIKGMAFGLPVGRKAEEYLRALGAEKQKMYYFPNTPDISAIVDLASQKFDQSFHDSICRRLDLPIGKKIILFVGRLINAKRPLDLVHAFARMRQLSPSSCNKFILVIAGDGPLRKSIQEAMNLIGEAVCLGWISDSMLIYSLMVIAEIMVLPSEHEPWGAVVNECMAAATPVIATKAVGAAYELIEDEVTGYKYEVGDVESLSHILLKISGDIAKLNVMGSNAQKRAIANGHEFASENLLRAIAEI